MILQLKINDIIAQVNDDVPGLRDITKLQKVAVHRCGKDLKNDIDLGDTAADICAHFTGLNERYPEVAKATGGEVPYTFMIGGGLGAPEFDGTIWQCLPLSETARHAKRWNQTAIGVAVIADPRVRPCTPNQMNSLIDLLSLLSLCIRQKPADCVVGHTELPGSSNDPNKECPGPLLPMDMLRKDVADSRADMALQLALMAGMVL